MPEAGKKGAGPQEENRTLKEEVKTLTEELNTTKKGAERGRSLTVINVPPVRVKPCSVSAGGRRSLKLHRHVQEEEQLDQSSADKPLLE